MFIDPTLSGKSLQLKDKNALILDNGKTFGPLNIAYQTYGQLNKERSNAILICHPLTCDQYAGDDVHPITGKKGWWHNIIGPGKIIDTNIYFVICANVLAGCMGTTGPASIDPEKQEAYGLNFPMITISDMVRAQSLLIDHLQIEQLFLVIGGSMGGMQLLQWCVSFPERVFAAIPIATSYRHPAQNIGFHEVGRQAIMADDQWKKGKYQAHNTEPKAGLAVARMTAHITYMSQMALHEKFGRRLQQGKDVSYSFNSDFQIESYLRYQGQSFVERFDANTYLYLTRAMDYFDLSQNTQGSLSQAFSHVHNHFCVISFSSDWSFTTQESKTLAHALNVSKGNVSCVDIQTHWGHDAFLMNVPEFHRVLKGFIQGMHELRGL